MKQIVSLKFRDLEEGCGAFASVRAGKRVVALGLSLESSGDVEARLSPVLARQLAAALEAAATQAEALGP